MNWSEFFAMGGYAGYVWGVYAIAAIVLGFNIVQPLLRRRDVVKRLRNYYRVKNKGR
jgi:heme exporter protein D